MNITSLRGEKISKVFQLPSGTIWTNSFLLQNNYAPFHNEQFTHNKLEEIFFFFFGNKRGTVVLAVECISYYHMGVGELQIDFFFFFYTEVFTWAQFLQTLLYMCLTSDTRIIQLKSNWHVMPRTPLGKLVITAGNIPWSYIYAGYLCREQM